MRASRENRHFLEKSVFCEYLEVGTPQPSDLLVVYVPWVGAYNQLIRRKKATMLRKEKYQKTFFLRFSKSQVFHGYFRFFQLTSFPPLIDVCADLVLIWGNYAVGFTSPEQCVLVMKMQVEIFWC